MRIRRFIYFFNLRKFTKMSVSTEPNKWSAKLEMGGGRPTEESTTRWSTLDSPNVHDC